MVRARVLTGASERAAAGDPAAAADEVEPPEVFEAAVAEGAAHARQALAVPLAAARRRHRRPRCRMQPRRAAHAAGGEQRRRGGQPVAYGKKQGNSFKSVSPVKVHFRACRGGSDSAMAHGFWYVGW